MCNSIELHFSAQAVCRIKSVSICLGISILQFHEVTQLSIERERFCTTLQIDPEEKRDQVGPLPGETIRADGSVDIVIHDTSEVAKAAPQRLSEQGSLLGRQVRPPLPFHLH